MLALPFGMPVVASRVGVFRELIEDGVTGWLVNPGDDVALARALEGAMRDPERRATVRRNIIARVATLWSWPTIARAHLEIYRRHLPQAVDRVPDDARSHAVNRPFDQRPAISAGP
jgi:hypothetical protein